MHAPNTTDDAPAGVIFDIKRYAIHDGPNLRTTVFLKGCPLACWWCHNPEGLDKALSMVTLPSKCVGCGDCIAACPKDALEMTPAGVERHETRCDSCSRCVDACPALAHECAGANMSVGEAVEEILKDQVFFDQSGGGVTFSGGEPLMQEKFLLELLQACGEHGIHRAVDTSGYAPQESMQRVSRHAELFLYDLKHMNDADHKKGTGVGNGLILYNFKQLARSGVSIRVRIPLIPGFNDDVVNLTETARFITASAPHGVVQGVDVLPLHASAKNKYRKLGQDYAKGAPDAAPQTELAVKIMKSHGLTPHVGG